LQSKTHPCSLSNHHEITTLNSGSIIYSLAIIACSLTIIAWLIICKKNCFFSFQPAKQFGLPHWTPLAQEMSLKEYHNAKKRKEKEEFEGIDFIIC